MNLRLKLVFSILSLSILFGSLISDKYIFAHFTGNNNIAPTMDFEEYSRMAKKSERNATLASESPEKKSILWKQHFAYQETKLALSERQKKFLNDLSEYLDEEFFAGANHGLSESEYINAKKGKPIGALIKQIPELFDREQSKQLFLTIGDTSTITDWGCGSASSENTVAETNGTNTLLSGCDCTASVCGSGCPEGTACKIGFPYPICPATPDGCGCFGYFSCDSQCLR